MLDPQTPVCAALRRFAVAHEKAGGARLVQDQLATTHFVQPLLRHLEVTVGEAMRARRAVQTARLSYDAARATLKSATPATAERARLDMEAAEDEFVGCVDTAMAKMKAVAGRSELLRALADLATAQRDYHRLAAAARDELVPELQELQATDAALASPSAV